MGTRGAVGFLIDGETKVTYNHFDSYPSYLGQHTIDAVKTMLKRYTLEGLRNCARTLRMVSEDEKPSDLDVKRFRHRADTSVSTGRVDEWYVLLREMQGDIAANIDAGVMIDSRGFLDDSLFCEWAYIVNLDTEELEVYRGFQSKHHRKGRYAARRRPGWKPSYPGENYYYPVALVASIPFAELPGDLAGYLENNFAVVDD